MRRMKLALLRFLPFNLCQCPVVIVPTKYYTTPTDQFRKWGVSAVIWANHNMRAAVSAMQAITKTIHNEESLVSVEKNVRGLLSIKLRFLLVL